MDYSATFTVPTDPATAKRAICDEMHIWWTKRVELDGPIATVRFNNSHATFDRGEPEGDTMRWPCLDANMIIEGVPDASEWTGTSLRWTIKPAGNGSIITLAHVGLNQDLECLDVCTRGWQHFFEGSLKAHLSGDAPSPETR